MSNKQVQEPLVQPPSSLKKNDGGRPPFRNCLWQVHSSISQMSTSVRVGSKAASWHSLDICAEHCLLFAHLCCQLRWRGVWMYDGPAASDRWCADYSWTSC